MRKRVAILGSTGSIGESTVTVVRNLNDRLQVVGVAARSNTARLAEQAAELGCRRAITSDPARFDALREAVPASCDVRAGDDAMRELATADDVDIVLCAIVGTAGLRPVLDAIRAGKDIALATKEILVMAGEIVMAEAAKSGSRILPVDSEHSAVFQCLHASPGREVRRIILTASGGAFRDRSIDELRTVTWREALAHPTWDMGRKVTIDSASLMNKGLELIEACRLFGLSATRIDVVIHPQSIFHSMVEFVDSSILAQLSYPDMCLPIQYALTFPERTGSHLRPFDFTTATTLELRPPDDERFPALRLARESVTTGGTMPAVFNAANEVAVDAFCEDRIGFLDIARVVERVMQRHTVGSGMDLDIILAADAWARAEAEGCCSERRGGETGRSDT